MLWVFDGKLRRRGGKRRLARRCEQLSQPLIHCATGVPKNIWKTHTGSGKGNPAPTHPGFLNRALDLRLGGYRHSTKSKINCLSHDQYDGCGNSSSFAESLQSSL